MFTLKKTNGAARRGILETSHGFVQTPIFMPIATRGAVKTLSADDIKGVGAQIILSEKNYKLVTVPPRIWFGFEAMGRTVALLANCATLPYEPSEIERLDPFSNKIPYQWHL